MTANKTFTFYLDDEKTGAKSYNIYVKNLSGNFTLTLTTGRSGKTNYVLKGGVNLTGRILVDDEGNITSQSLTATSSVSSGNSQPVTSGGVADAIAPLQPIDSVTNGNLHPVTSNAVYAKLLGFISKDKLPYTTLTSGQNINNLKTEGVYQAEYDAIGNSLIGRPNENIYSSFLFVMIAKNNEVVQIIISCGTGNIYVRQANTLQADWKDWHKLSYTTIAPTT